MPGKEKVALVTGSAVGTGRAAALELARRGHEIAVIKQFAIAKAPLKRVCEAEDVALVIAQLVEAELITGQVLVVDGGMTIAG